MGTPDFSVGILLELIKSGHEISGVITQPDKPKGRGKNIQFTPVKTAALEHNISIENIYQPVKIKDKEFVKILKKIPADIYVVAAFGQLLSDEILNIPKYGCVNVHASLLPKYRGAAPIQWAVINGDKISGITTMRMNSGLDTGDMIMKQEVVLQKEETGGSLFEKLAMVGAKLCVETLKAIEDKTAVYEKQNEDEATHVSMLDKKSGEINWDTSSAAIERLIRGLNPWPSAYTKINGKTMKIWRAQVNNIDDYADKVPGEIVSVEKDSINVKTKDGVLEIKELQLEGKKRMNSDAFLRGCKLETGIVLK